MWINGIRQQTLPADDRAVHFGDGCFTTAAVRNGKVDFFAAHLRRLQWGCEQLLINNVDWHQLENEMLHAAQQEDRAVLKVIISAGRGGRGYSRQGCEQATRIVSLGRWPEHYQRWQSSGVKLKTSPVRLAQNPLLAGIKHLNRLEQVLIRAHLDQSDADEALVLDTAGCVVECCAANLFWRRGDMLFTPDLTQAGVAGTMRRRLLDHFAETGRPCHQLRCEPAHLLAADEVIVCNALMPILPVRQIDNYTFSERTLFNQLMDSFN